MVLRPFHILHEEADSVSAVELPVTDTAKIHILDKREVRDRPRFEIGQQVMFCGINKYDMSLGNTTGPPSTLLNKKNEEQSWLFQVNEEERGPEQNWHYNLKMSRVRSSRRCPSSAGFVMPSGLRAGSAITRVSQRLTGCGRGATRVFKYFCSLLPCMQ